MAASVELTTISTKSMTPQEFAILIEKLMPGRTGLLLGGKCTIKNSNTVHVNVGWCVIRGRLVNIIAGDMTVTLPSTGSKKEYVVISIDLANVSNPAKIELMDSVPEDTDTFNTTNGTAYLKLAEYTSTASAGIKDIMSTEEIPPQPVIRIGSEDPSTIKGNPGDIYIQI